jgi:hypothetical protein
MMIVSLTAPSFARATPGEMSEPAPLPALPWSAPFEATLLPVTTPDSLGWYFCSMCLEKGQTISATMTVGSDMGPSKLFAFSPQGAYLGTTARLSGSSRVGNLKVMAPREGNYSFMMLADRIGDFSFEVATTTPVPYKLISFGVPKTKKRRSKFAVSVRTNPRYNGFVSPVRFQIERRIGGKWRAFSSVGGRLAEEGERYSRCSAKMKLSKRGTYRIRAKLADAAHPKATFTGWKTIKVR